MTTRIKRVKKVYFGELINIFKIKWA